MRLLLLCAALLCGNALAASSWVRLDVPGGYWEYDQASIVVLPENRRRILARFTVSGMLQDKPTGQHYDHAIFLIEVDCDKRMQRVVDVVMYLRAERVEPSRTSEDWRPSAPTSTLHKAACS
jgi:hypothetical protein